jgi:hypothetical protein
MAEKKKFIVEYSKQSLESAREIFLVCKRNSEKPNNEFKLIRDIFRNRKFKFLYILNALLISSMLELLSFNANGNCSAMMESRL